MGLWKGQRAAAETERDWIPGLCSSGHGKDVKSDPNKKSNSDLWSCYLCSYIRVLQSMSEIQIENYMN